MSRLPVKGPVVIPNCVMVKLKWSDAGRLYSNVFHGNLTQAGPLNPSLAETLFTAIKTATSTTTWQGHLTTTVSLTGVDVKDLRNSNNPTLASTSAATLGTGTGGPLPLNAALVITLLTAQSGQGFRGRAYLGGMVATVMNTATTVSDTISADGVAFVAGINSIMTTNAIPMVVAQRALNAGTHADGSPWAARPAGVVPVTSVVNRNARVDSQRRRTGR